ncbi:MAG TPA: VOC family protein [Candidatus Limnocylindrales bacterium]|nr:VOC family protein [Candidatus Limnocylindrales bacterium]
MQKIITSLWFDTQAEEAATFYSSLVPDSRVVNVTRYGPGAPMPEGTAITVEFELAGQAFNALNGGPAFHFTEATSLIINCDDQAEVDRLWSALAADGGEAGQCGWLKDRFGFSWQIVPRALGDYLFGSDADAAGRAMQAMLQMQKLDIDEIQRAYDGG